jgi:hypothetical protein
VNQDGSITINSILVETTATVDQNGNIGKNVTQVTLLEKMSAKVDPAQDEASNNDIQQTSTRTPISSVTKAFDSNDALGKATEAVSEYKKIHGGNDKLGGLSPVQAQAKINGKNSSVTGRISFGTGILGTGLSLVPIPLINRLGWGITVASTALGGYSIHEDFESDPEKLILYLNYHY